MFIIQRIFIWCNCKKKIHISSFQIGLHHGKSMCNIKKTSLRKRVCAQIIRKGILIIKPSVSTLDHTGRGGYAKNFAIYHSIGCNQLITECKMILEVVSCLGKPVKINASILCLEGRKFCQGTVL